MLKTSKILVATEEGRYAPLEADSLTDEDMAKLKAKREEQALKWEREKREIKLAR